ncbi:MAG: fibrobacter succinogenes major paralogous domain-containing protein [Flavobacteriaceae bacterium]|nr:fibrobacter succinogenes major paralogous domain-containing protein [Flavobacteriaceae bacterium]
MIALVLISTNAFAQVGIGTETPHASAKLDVTSTTQGFLPPRMTFLQRDFIASPSEGLTIYNINTKCLETYNGINWISLCDGSVSPAVFIDSGACSGAQIVYTFNSQTYKPIESVGQCWLDRNLGASRVALFFDDLYSRGYLYQWGRGVDGHEVISSDTTTILSSTDYPGNGNFIVSPNTPRDWRSPQNSNLWQGVNGVNNPCPSGFRLPTQTELNIERASWSSDDIYGAFASSLKLPTAGFRSTTNGEIIAPNARSAYWSSTVGSTTDGDGASYLNILSFQVEELISPRGTGRSVRCIKD